MSYARYSTTQILRTRADQVPSWERTSELVYFDYKLVLA